MGTNYDITLYYIYVIILNSDSFYKFNYKKLKILCVLNDLIGNLDCANN